MNAGLAHCFHERNSANNPRDEETTHERFASIFSGSSNDSEASSLNGTPVSPESSSSAGDDSSCGFHNAWGTAADFQVSAESSALFPSNELTTISYGSLDTGTDGSSFGSFSSAGSFHQDDF